MNIIEKIEKLESIIKQALNEIESLKECIQKKPTLRDYCPSKEYKCDDPFDYGKEICYGCDRNIANNKNC